MFAPDALLARLGLAALLASYRGWVGAAFPISTALLVSFLADRLFRRAESWQWEGGSSRSCVLDLRTSHLLRRRFAPATFETTPRQSISTSATASSVGL